MSVSQQQQLSPEREQPYVYSASQQSGVNNSPLNNILKTETNKEKSYGTMDEDVGKIGPIPAIVTLVLSSTYCLISLCILLVIPILELAFGAAYRDQCTIEPYIPIYLIVTGACGIASIVLTLAIVVAIICCFKQKSTGGSFAIGCVIGLVVLIIFLMSLFLFAWFIAGSVWVFRVTNTVNYDDILSPNYCHRTLYQFAFAMLIINYVMIGISCCSSCCRMCCSGKRSSDS